MATRSRSTSKSKPAAKKSAAKRPSRAKPKAQITLNGRFPAGTRVRLVKVAGEHVLRSQGGKLIDTARVGDDGQVVFSKGVELGARYFVCGYIDGTFTEVRVRGNAPGEDPSSLAQAPVQPDVTTLGIGRVPVNTDLEPHGTRLAQEQVGDDVQQRSATATGSAHPVDPDERGPYPDQASELYSSGKVQQRSDTAVGQATPIADVPERQEDVPASVPQRSNTATGVATPLPPGDAVAAVCGIESADAKAAVGEPGQAEIRGVVPGQVVKGGGSRHEDRYVEDYVPVGPGQDPGEGRPEGLRPSGEKASRRKR